MKSSTKRKIKQTALALTQHILLSLLETYELMPGLFENKYDHARRLKGYSGYQTNRSFRELSRQELIKKRVRQGKVYYSLTKKGLLKSLRYSCLCKPRIVKLNGLLTIVIFDIPESHRSARNFLRAFLKENGFKILQKSVFTASFEIQEEFYKIVDVLNMKEYVQIIEGKITQPKE